MHCKLLLLLKPLLALLLPFSLWAEDYTGKTSSGKSGEIETVLEGALDFSILESIAIQDGGRYKPLQTFAMESIEQITGRPLFSSRPYYKDEQNNLKLNDIDTLLSIWLKTRDWSKEPIILIGYDPLRSELGLPKGEGFAAKRFSYDQIQSVKDKFDLIWKGAAAKRHEKKEKTLTDLEKEAELVKMRINLLMGISYGDPLHIVPHPTEPTGVWLSLDALDMAIRTPDRAAQYMAQYKYAGDTAAAIQLIETYRNAYTDEMVNSLFSSFRNLAKAFHARDAAKFREASIAFSDNLRKMSTLYPVQTDLNREISYNTLRPFGRAWPLYLLASILGLVSLFFARNKVFYGLFWLTTLAGFALHVYGFILRSLVAGRPPVSNMYESVIWVGFGCVFFALIFELKYKARYYLVSGVTGGFLCLVLMDLVPVLAGNASMPGFENQINPLQPVLQNNFWLTVHVLTITLSYAAFALAWVLGHVTLFKTIINPLARKENAELHLFIYRVVQVGVLLLTIGTILGGVWAYYSWGRFWGWDPKETWAFIALVLYLVVLHGRFAGIWTNFALSVGAVVCFLSVVMAWYGVNFVLGSGLHSYGSGAGGLGIAISLCTLDLTFVGIAILRHLSAKNTRIKEDVAAPEASHTL